MTGYRRTRGEATRWSTRAGRRADLCMGRVAAAGTWWQRISPAAGHVVAALKRYAALDPAAAEAYAEAIARILIEAAAELDKITTKAPDRGGKRSA